MQQIKSGIKKRWTPQQDQALREIKQNLKYKSWSMISKKMSTDFGFDGRSQKQCRDRYQNYLKGQEQSFLWSQEQQKKMFKLFGKQGSRWQLISSYFTNIKGIHIKNKFYTRVRKAIRQVNSVIEFYFSKKYTPFQFTIISKLVSLISRHVEQTKYQKKEHMIKRQQNININNNTIIQQEQQQHQHIIVEILYKLIELTNHEGCELFPQLGLRHCPQMEKKKLFKRLIKRLKLIESQYQKSTQFHANHVNRQSFNTSKDNQVDNHLNSNNFDQKRQGKYEQHFQQQRYTNVLLCSYKLITNDRQRQRSHYSIVSRIKRFKLTSQRQYQKVQKNQKLQKLQKYQKQEDDSLLSRFQELEELGQFSEHEQKQQQQQFPNNISQIPHPQVLAYPQFYLLNTQPAIYLTDNIEFNNIQFYFNMK